MRVPLRHVVDNLTFTVHGTVWAIYRITPRRACPTHPRGCGTSCWPG
ncbi:hypothetical protein ACFQZC_38415 [Streptacidiphilus monticola]